MKQESTLNFLYQFDIIFLNEVKINFLPHVNGFKPFFKGINDINYKHGGTLLLVKNYLLDSILEITNIGKNIIGIRFYEIPDTMIFGCYIPPTTSYYFDHIVYTLLQEKIKQYSNMNIVLLGDVNARFGQTLTLLNDTDRQLTYHNMKDECQNMNQNAKYLKQLLPSNKLKIINNLHTNSATFPGDLTFKRNTRWISEIDLIITNVSNITQLSHFKIHKSNLPSNHAPISIQIHRSATSLNIDTLIKDSHLLGTQAVVENKNSIVRKKSIKTKLVNKPLFLDGINGLEIQNSFQNINEWSQYLSDNIYSNIRNCIIQETSRFDYSMSQWQRIIDMKDSAKLWKALNYKGEFPENCDTKPSDNDFKQHLSEVFMNTDSSDIDIPFHTSPSFPFIDRAINVDEVVECSKTIKDTSGDDGICAGIFKYLPIVWLAFIASFLTNVFLNSTFPVNWCTNRLFMLHKKGDKMNCNNYRGITTIGALPKLYYTIICTRLRCWFRPLREQAGDQKNRNCIENILTLRLLIAYAKKKKVKLFVLLIDFQKAYDKIPRNKLFEVLYQFGCSAILLTAIITMYNHTSVLLGMTLIGISAGVMQGAPCSGTLFIIYIEKLVRMLRDNNNSKDSFLNWLTCLLFMDDAAILAHDRNTIEQRFKILMEFCQTYKMHINEDKSHLLVINGEENDEMSLNENGIEIKSCQSFTYLGAIFTKDGNIKNSLEMHTNDKQKQLHKFISFLVRNQNAPYFLKMKVFEAALTSSIVYSCESWFDIPLRSLKTLYHTAIKSLLDVRLNTCNDVCLIETGLLPLEFLIKNIQQRSYRKLLNDETRSPLDDPFMFAYELSKNANVHFANYIFILSGSDVNYKVAGIQHLENSIRSNNSSKRVLYRKMNPQLSVHSIYLLKNASIPEFKRKSFTRFRLSAHSLKIESGRWSRPITPLESRTCLCDSTSIQSEEHVTLECPLTSHIRNQFQEASYSIPQIFEWSSEINLVTFIHEILRKFQN